MNEYLKPRPIFKNPVPDLSTLRFEQDLTPMVDQVVRVMMADQERVIELEVIEILKSRGYIVEQPRSGAGISGAAVARFRAAWHAADKAGRAGNRVRAGLEAARSAMNLNALGFIDRTLDSCETIDSPWRVAEVRELLRVIRVMLADPADDVGSEIKPLVADGVVVKPKRERWRCLRKGCNPRLWSEADAKAHRTHTSHRVAKWPVRSAEGHRRQRERNEEVSRARKQERRMDQQEADRDDPFDGEYGDPDFLGGDFGG